MDLCYRVSTARFSLGQDGGSLLRTVRNVYSINRANYDSKQAVLRDLVKGCRGAPTATNTFPLKLRETQPAFFLPLISSWGWATWRRAWRLLVPDFSALEQLGADAVLRRRFDLDGAYPFYELLERQGRGEADSWAVRWYLSVFLLGGLTLFPSASLVRSMMPAIRSGATLAALAMA